MLGFRFQPQEKGEWKYSTKNGLTYRQKMLVYFVYDHCIAHQYKTAVRIIYHIS